MRVLLGITTLLVVAGFVSAADNPPAADRAAVLKQIQADMVKANAALEESVQKATTNAEAQKLEAEYVAKAKGLLEQAVKLFKDVPTDATAGDAAFFVYEYGTAEQIAAAGEQILNHHANDKRLRGAIGASLAYGEHALPFLKEVPKKTADKEPQALSYYVIARILAEKSEAQGQAPEAAQKYVKLAEGYFAQAAETNATMKLGTKVTMAEAVKEELYSLQNLSVGKAAPDFEGDSFDGTKAKLSSFRGKVVVLKFWQTTCGPCLARIPHERELVKAMEKRPFSLIGINVDDRRAVGKAFVEERNMNWPQWWSDFETGPANAYRVQFFPSVYVIDAKGVIRYKHLDARTLAAKVEELVKEAEAKP